MREHESIIGLYISEISESGTKCRITFSDVEILEYDGLILKTPGTQVGLKVIGFIRSDLVGIRGMMQMGKEDHKEYHQITIILEGYKNEIICVLKNAG